MKHVIYSTIPTQFIQACPIIGGKIHAVVDDDFNHLEAEYAATQAQIQALLKQIHGTP